MTGAQPVEPRYGATKAGLLRELERVGREYGHQLTATVMVNGRPVLLESAIRLIAQLPDGTLLGRRGIHVFIEPDPFAARVAGTDESREALVDRLRAGSTGVERLRAGLAEAGRRATEEQPRRRWWQRLVDQRKEPD